MNSSRERLVFGRSLEGRPLIPMKTAQIILDLDADAVLAELERGDLGWAWDIRSVAARRREIRIWRNSIMARAGGHGRDTTARLLPDHVLAQILPPQSDVRLMDVAGWLACSGSHVANLIRDGLLSVRGCRPSHIRHRAMTWVTRESLAQFLSARRVSFGGGIRDPKPPFSNFPRHTAETP